LHVDPHPHVDLLAHGDRSRELPERERGARGDYRPVRLERLPARESVDVSVAGGCGAARPDPELACHVEQLSLPLVALVLHEQRGLLGRGDRVGDQHPARRDDGGYVLVRVVDQLPRRQPHRLAPLAKRDVVGEEVLGHGMPASLLGRHPTPPTTGQLWEIAFVTSGLTSISPSSNVKRFPEGSWPCTS